jgi:hypothetical protein
MRKIIYELPDEELKLQLDGQRKFNNAFAGGFRVDSIAEQCAIAAFYRCVEKLWHVDIREALRKT